MHTMWTRFMLPMHTVGAAIALDLATICALRALMLCAAAARADQYCADEHDSCS